MKNQKGMALLQVLLLSILLAVVVSAATLGARQQVNLTYQLQQRTEARLQTLSIKNELYFTFLTQPWTADPDSGGIRQSWNFYGKPFQYQGYDITIQDMSGLIFLGSNGAHDLGMLLSTLGLEQEQVDSFSAAYLDWQDSDDLTLPLGAEASDYSGPIKPRNSPIQDFSELKFIKNAPLALLPELKRYATLFPRGNFNPIDAPDIVLRAMLPATQADAVVELRNQGKLNAVSLYQLTGISDDLFTSTAPGPGFRIELAKRGEGIHYRYAEEVSFSPSKQTPVSVWSVSP